MSISPKIYEHENQNSERRSGSRARLNWVVLVYFGKDNWGKLVDLSSSGMRFEFAQPPLNHEGVDFRFEAMGRLPASCGGEMISDSFQAAGDVRWTCDFERTAGVRFVNLGEGSREQIRKWLSFESSTVAGLANGKTEEEAPTRLPDPLEPALAPPETLPTIYEDEWQLDAERADSSAEPRAYAATPVAEEILEGPVFEDYSGTMAEEEERFAETAGSDARMSRAQTMGVTVGLAALVVIGGIIVILPRHNTGSVSAVKRIPSPTAVDGDTFVTEYGSAARSRRPFLVEVLDANNRQWLLWFEADSSKDEPTQAAYKSLRPASTDSSRDASRPKQPAASAKPAAPHKFALVAPKASHPETNSSAANSSSLVAPVVRDELHPPWEAPIATILTSRATPKPAEESTPIGGRVLLARLRKSVPPVYPPFARTSHVSGDVKLDALIDANGNVTELKVISGPPILRQPAMDAVRQWKYDPARLNGQPVALHLGVTVRFRVE
jgi:protein TonB